VPQLRQNIITGEWVVFAPERAKRPSDYISISSEKKQDKKNCPFCLDSTNSEYENRLKGFDGEFAYVLTNKFPAFIEDNSVCNPKALKIEDDFFEQKASLGGHDVVAMRDHEIDMPKFSIEMWTDLFQVIKKRYNYFEDICNVEYVMPIYNHGPEAAASIEHPHAQIFASSIIPNTISKELLHTAKYHHDKKTCAFCDLVKHELEQNTRVLFENEDFVAFNFYAARFPFETWILPKDHQSHFTHTSGKQLENFSKICQQVFNRLDVVLNDPPVNFFIHSAPAKEKDKMAHFHWHMEIAPRLANYGGYEMGSGVIIDIIPPESAADYLRLGQKVKNQLQKH